MKIAMLSVHSCPLGKLGGESTGGMSVYIRELARELGRRGHEVDVFTRLHEPYHDPTLHLGENARLIHIAAGKEEETNRLSVYAHLGDFACGVERFKKKNGLHYDLIHSHYWISGSVGRWMQRSWGVPHLMTFHTLGAVKNGLGLGEKEPPLRLNTEEELVRECSRIIASTRKEKEDLVHHYGASPQSIGIIPCGVNLDLFRPVDKQLARSRIGLNGGPILLFVGRIIPLKGIDRLLMAMADLERSFSIEHRSLGGSRGAYRNMPRLIVIGGDEDSLLELDRLRRLSKNLLISESVDFLGFVEHERLPFFYSAADVCVVPSYYESFGLVAMESLACGTPVVSTRVGGIESVVRPGDTGFLVNDNTPQFLAEKIALLLSHSKKKSGSQESIRGSVSRYSWANVAEAILGEYREVLNQSLPRCSSMAADL